MYATQMYQLGKTSSGRLLTCHPLLQMVVRHAIVMTPMDFAVDCGFRGREAQNQAFENEYSTKKFPYSWHNHLADPLDVAEGFAREVDEELSMAVDLVPFLKGRKRWNLPKEIRWLNGWVMGAGMSLVLPHGFYLRSGVDWDMDGDQTEHKLVDAPHIELRRLLQ